MTANKERVCSLGIAIFSVLGFCPWFPCHAQATGTTTIFRLPWENTTLLDCGDGNQDVVTYGSTLLVVAHFGVDAHGGVHTEVQDTFQGGSGIGESGARYVAVATDHTGFNTQVLPFETTFVLTQLLVGEGRAPKFLVHVTIHQTINANGETTADVVNVVFACR
jgi:hypothetical protein